MCGATFLLVIESEVPSCPLHCAVLGEASPVRIIGAATFPKRAENARVTGPVGTFRKRLNLLSRVSANARFWESCDFGLRREAAIHDRRQDNPRGISQKQPQGEGVPKGVPKPKSQHA